MVGADTDGIHKNHTEVATSATIPDGMELMRSPVYTPRLGEILVVLFVLVVWAVAILVFLRRWARIRILQPMEPRYRHNPKNLESVKIVKRAQDSIIYKNYNKKLSGTIVAREKKRLQRIHTIAALPSMEMGRAVTNL